MNSYQIQFHSFFICFSIIQFFQLSIFYPISCSTRTWLFPLFSSCITRQNWFRPDHTPASCPVLLPPARLSPITLAPSLPPIAGSSCVYIHAACNCRTRPAVHLKLAPPLPGGCLLSCGFPFCSPCTFVYLLSSNLYQSYHCTYMVFLQGLVHLSCTSP